MNAIAELHPRTLASLRGAYIRDLIENYGLTGNTVADRSGISRSTFASRLRGATAFLADEIESIAVPLRIEPTELYAAYLSVRPDTPEGDRSLFIAVGPAGIEPTTSTVKQREFGDEHVAPVIDINQARRTGTATIEAKAGTAS